MPGNRGTNELDDFLRLIPRSRVEEHADDFLGPDPHGNPARRRHPGLEADLGDLLQRKRLDPGSRPSLSPVASDDDALRRHVHRRSDPAQMPQEMLIASEVRRSGRLRLGKTIHGEGRVIRPAGRSDRPTRRRVWHGNGLLTLGGLRMRPTPEGYGIDYK
jgi:hypothetical protein